MKSFHQMKWNKNTMGSHWMKSGKVNASLLNFAILLLLATFCKHPPKKMTKSPNWILRNSFELSLSQKVTWTCCFIKILILLSLDYLWGSLGILWGFFWGFFWGFYWDTLGRLLRDYWGVLGGYWELYSKMFQTDTHTDSCISRAPFGTEIDNFITKWQ